MSNSTSAPYKVHPSEIVEASEGENLAAEENHVTDATSIARNQEDGGGLPQTSPGLDFAGIYVWDWVIIVLTFYSIILIPLQIAFANELGSHLVLSLVSRITDIVFIVDVYLNFRTAYLDEDRYEIKERRQIVRRYLNTWFVVDFLACMQFDLILKGVVADEYQVFFPINKLARITRVIKRLDEMVLTGYLRIAKLLGTFLVMAHVIGCMFFALGRIEALYSDTGHWLHEYSIIDRSTGFQYLSCLYWAFATLGTVGYGDIAAVSFWERGFAIVVMFFGSIMYASIFGTFTNLIQERDRHRNQYNERVARINDFARSNQLPRFVRERLVRYHEATWQLRKVLVGDIMEGVPESAQIDIMVFLYMDLVRTVPIFSRCSQRLLEKVVMCFTQDIFLSGDFLMRQGDEGRELFFIVKGDIEVYTHKGKNADVANMDFDDIIADSYFVVSRGPGAFIGEGSLLYGERRGASVRAVAPVVQTLTLTKDAFMSCVRDSPEVLKMMRGVASRRAKESTTSRKSQMPTQVTSGSVIFSNLRKSMTQNQQEKEKEDLEGQDQDQDKDHDQDQEQDQGPNQNESAALKIANEASGGETGAGGSGGTDGAHDAMKDSDAADVHSTRVSSISKAIPAIFQRNVRADSTRSLDRGAPERVSPEKFSRYSTMNVKPGRQSIFAPAGDKLANLSHARDESEPLSRPSFLSTAQPSASNISEDAAREMDQAAKDAEEDDFDNSPFFPLHRNSSCYSSFRSNRAENEVNLEVAHRLDAVQSALAEILSNQEERFAALEKKIADQPGTPRSSKDSNESCSSTSAQ
ncbi:Potassium voltage-gated channel protein eag [Hondaea fermentalgiana]|uniref:Potassium voltage-gated channel protein eag n=1 Tax=Hondaea fermentalgiana TaxID=2315210 RepID=A0A2R5GBN3_9STRA|nr:Potassium voltage-gated channel protein eag [Hondaea fermentalgiana]|eukprot:GBG27128.1 Potassium voltage-gated channel protein eag [Hondaea fermentalgiana]